MTPNSTAHLGLLHSPTTLPMSNGLHTFNASSALGHDALPMSNSLYTFNASSALGHDTLPMPNGPHTNNVSSASPFANQPYPHVGLASQTSFGTPFTDQLSTLAILPPMADTTFSSSNSNLPYALGHPNISIIPNGLHPSHTTNATHTLGHDASTMPDGIHSSNPYPTITIDYDNSNVLCSLNEPCFELDPTCAIDIDPRTDSLIPRIKAIIDSVRVRDFAQTNSQGPMVKEESKLEGLQARVSEASLRGCKES